ASGPDRAGDGGGVIGEGGVGDVETGEVLDDLLEVQQRLEPTLGDLGLVRGVGGVPGGVLDEVAADDGRGDRVKVALADELGAHDVLAGQVAQIGEAVVFGAAGREVEPLVLDRGGGGRGREGGQRNVAAVAEHAPGSIGAGAAWRG